MKFKEVYKPVFEQEEGDRPRQLRADFGSRKMTLECATCSYEFSKRVGPNTGFLNCPSCGANRVKPALSEKAKKSVAKMHEGIENGNISLAIQKGLSVINDLHGRTDKRSINLMQEALTGILSIERGLVNMSDELTDHIKNGTGKDVIKSISEKLGYKPISLTGDNT